MVSTNKLILCILGFLVFNLSWVSELFAADLENRNKILEMYIGYKKDFPDINDISPKDLSLLNNIVIVDVRELVEIDVSFIPESITKNTFEKNSSQYKTKTIVVYCTIGYRSGLYTKQLIEKGFKAYNVIGGILLWSHDMKVLYTKNNVPTKKIHVYGEKWNLAHSSFEPVW